jgi:hypothetical protein
MILSMARLIAAFLLFGFFGSASYGYSVLSHEAIVDSVWDDPIQRLLTKRFPDATPEQLKEAHGYAYGGCIIQDMGYYPFANKMFSDLAHYVRSGDFVMAMMVDSQDVDEYAFALGALAHYAADVSGHGIAVNHAVPILYPRLRTKFGAIVTYWDNPLSHIRTEFGFDALQLAQARYAPDAYREFIGFKVAKPLLERAFQDTYGLEMKDLFGGHEDLALGSFRYATSSIIPGMTKVAWQLRKDTIVKEVPGMTKKKFLFNLSRSDYEKTWGKDYQRPGFGARMLALMLRLIPKFGPFKGLAFRAPTPEVEVLFMKSFNTTVDQYRAMLQKEGTDHLVLPDDNFDTGLPTEAGKYLGADLTYDKWLDKLAEKKFAGVNDDIRKNILTYYDTRKPPAEVAASEGAPEKGKKKYEKAEADWQKTQNQLEQLRQLQIAPAAAAPASNAPVAGGFVAAR